MQLLHIPATLQCVTRTYTVTSDGPHGCGVQVFMHTGTLDVFASVTSHQKNDELVEIQYTSGISQSWGALGRVTSLF